MNKFDYVSDLHLSFNCDDQFIKQWDINAPYLILAGDIIEADLLYHPALESSLSRFFKFLSNSYIEVFWVLGNHEHYQSPIHSTQFIIEDYLSDINAKNIRVLHENFVQREEFLIFGATLWADMSKKDPLICYMAQSAINDYRMIWKDNHKTPIQVNDTIELHEHHLQLIRDFILKDSDLPKIVVTHHAPSHQSVSQKYRTSTMMGAHSSELWNLIDNSDIRVWIHGHTHHRVDYKINNCRVLSNPRGYYGQESISNEFYVKSISLNIDEMLTMPQQFN